MAGRRAPERNQLALRGLAVIGLLVAALGLAYLRVTGAIGGDPALTAQVRDAGGALRPGSDVKLELTIAEDTLERVPANVVARILPATVFGTTFLDLVPDGERSTEPLQAGATIPADTRQGTLELQQALDDIDRLVKALGPAELQSAISAMATALDGRGQQIGRLIDTADRYLGRLEPRLPLLRSDLRKLADNLDLVDEIAPELLDATENSLVTVDTIVTQRASIAALITGGTTLARTAGSFLGRNEQRIVRMLENGALLLDILYDNRRIGITGAIATNNRLGQVVPPIVQEGFVRTDGRFTTQVPRMYGPQDRPTYGRMSLRGLSGGGG